MLFQGYKHGDKLAKSFVKGSVMKLGLGIGPLGAPGGERMVELAKEGENLGYDTIWCHP